MLFTEEELNTHSVRGGKSNKVKVEVQKPALDPTRLLALKRKENKKKISNNEGCNKENKDENEEEYEEENEEQDEEEDEEEKEKEDGEEYDEEEKSSDGEKK
ncbi:uncharacterized protein LOC130670522 [Microplitis mediator]|uniref:uncharacterized protein LOC130670522 n=1 Tax=Microplitis mediator TaxID=375433 RepID=UPI002555C709|nr:uncharacterized protein LOC130670522 [Microplitis mediator]